MTGHKTGEIVTSEFTVSSPTTGNAANADVLPVGTLVINGVDNAAVVTVTNKEAGLYTFSVTLPVVTDGDELHVRIEAIAQTVVGKAIVWSGVGTSYRLSEFVSSLTSDGAMPDGVGLKANVEGWKGRTGAIAITQASNKIIGGGASSYDVPLVGANVTRFDGYLASQFIHIDVTNMLIEYHGHVHGFAASALTEVRDAVRTEIAQELLVINRYGTMITDSEPDGVYEFLAAALVNAPAGGSGGTGLSPEQEALLADVLGALNAGATPVYRDGVDNAGRIVVIRGDDWAATFDCPEEPAEAWLTIKREADDADADALVQLTMGTGLEILNGEIATAAHGTLTWAAGVLTARIFAEATTQLKPRERLPYDLQLETSVGLRTSLGTATIAADVTRALA